jgi:hypothetical protein
MKAYFRNIILGLLLFSISTASLGMEFFIHYCPISKESKYVLDQKKCCGAPIEEDGCCHTTKEFKKTDPADHHQKTVKLTKFLPVIITRDWSLPVDAIFVGSAILDLPKNSSPPPLSGRDILTLISVFII